MTKAIELAEAYSNAVSEHRLESLYGTSKSYTLEKAKERDEASETLTAELRRLAAVEQELAAIRALEPVADVTVSGEDFDIGFKDDYAFGVKRLSDGTHNLYALPEETK